MKKSIVLFLSVTTMSIAAWSQHSFGFKAGVNNSFITYRAEGTGGDPDEVYLGSTTGFQVGGVANFGLSSKFTVQPNLLFTMRGGAIEGYKISTMHVELPINLLYTHNNFFVGAGPNFAMGVSGKIKDVPGGDLDIYDKDKSGTYALKKFEVGANVILGYNFPSGLTISANYTPGISDIYDGAGMTSDISARSKFFGFSIGYLFSQSVKKEK